MPGAIGTIKLPERGRTDPIALCRDWGQLETIKFLLKQKAPLEVKNFYGGTVLEQTLWSAAHGGDPKVYAAIIKEGSVP